MRNLKFYSHTNTINHHWNWKSSLAFEGFDNFSIEVPKHGFTHTDAPSHMIRGGKSWSECPLNLLCNWANLVDVSDRLGDKPITAEYLDKKSLDIPENEIIILRSNLNDIYPNTSPEYWNQSPFLEDSGSNWLVERNPTALVFDFPQDRAAKNLQHRVVLNEEFTEHQIVLGANILHLEHAIDLRLLSSNRFYFFGLPIPIPNSDGANCTPISIFGLEDKTYDISDHTQELKNTNRFRSFLTLDFENGDQVQETGFCMNGISQTCFVTKNERSRDKFFKGLVTDKFEVAQDIGSITDTPTDALIFLGYKRYSLKELIKKIQNKVFDILCLDCQPAEFEITKLLELAPNLMLNMTNIDQLTEHSLLVFGPLKISNSLVAPARVISIN